jgi:hypothetical protein
MSERDEPLSPRKYSGAVYCAVARMLSWSMDHLGRSEIDNLHCPGLVDHDVLRPDVLVQHLQPMEGLQSLGDLLYDTADGLEIRPRVVDHPLGQGLPVDETP